MKEYPILFQPDMVGAILEGRKTQTRRTTGLKEVNENPDNWEYAGCFVDMEGELINQFINKETRLMHNFKCPYGAEGSILWTREAWRKYINHPDKASYYHGEEVIEYAADGHGPLYESDGDGCQVFKKDGTEKMISWKPSIHMKKEDVRIYSQNTGVRIQRLQDISEEDAIAEGIKSFRPVPGDGSAETKYYHYLKNKWGPSPLHSFQTLIEKIHGPEIWDLNPWVRAISFRVLSTTGRPDNLEELCEAL